MRCCDVDANSLRDFALLLNSQRDPGFPYVVERCVEPLDVYNFEHITSEAYNHQK